MGYQAGLWLPYVALYEYELGMFKYDDGGTVTLMAGMSSLVISQKFSRTDLNVPRGVPSTPAALVGVYP
jgi:hypothetical protein